MANVVSWFWDNCSHPMFPNQLSAVTRSGGESGSILWKAWRMLKTERLSKTSGMK
jgi:hypothetical protein